jgi:hypothetical protein
MSTGKHRGRAKGEGQRGQHDRRQAATFLRRAAGRVMFVDGVLIMGANSLGRAMPIPLGGLAAGRLGQGLAIFVIGEQPLDAAGRIAHVARLVEQAGVAFANQTGDAARARRDDRQARRHRFEHDVPHRFGFRGVHERIGRGVGGGQVGAGAIADELRVQAGETSLEFDPLRTVADHGQPSLRYPPQHVGQKADVLLRRQS